MKTELLIVGGGPGGYVAAIRAAQLGKEVTLIEQDRLGGVCLNVGCIPSKALIHAANLYHKIPELEPLGISVEGLHLDLGRLQSWKEGVVARLREGIAKLLAANGVRVIQGRASFISEKAAELEGPEGETIEFGHCIVAPGSRPLELPGLEFDHELVLDSTDALALREVPAALIVIGGGYIGLELGTLYAKLGSKVTVVEIMDQLLPGVPAELVRPVERRLRGLGVGVLLRAKAKGLRRGRLGAELLVETPEGEQRLEAEKILQAVGRGPNTAALGLEEAGVELTERGFIRVDGRFRTSNPRIFAIGDAAGPPMLAHKASHEGLLAAEALAGLPTAPFKAVPAVIFTDPEVAYVGLSEAEAQAQGRRIVVGKFPFAALGRAAAMGEAEGFVKLVADAESKALLGAEIVGPEASSLIGEAALAVEAGATLEDLARTVHPHPTLPEALMEAALAGLERPIHLFVRRRPGN
ncbi:MAG: dihydrolipoyl dehydrogenase [Candidatus Acetothermia bacterium]|jgi:dihydrolipoamide dehydrogenase|nr:dihydrolipoyl dehydrogenase [Candidatus Acetothermia bacterium]MDH7505271.1 dihydrolipoyl dehydrogenase [Candidatus Acetothermia bacterium]